MNHDLKHCKDITLLMKAETIDGIVRRNGGVPIPEERQAYAAIIGEIERRRRYPRLLPYYKERLTTIYQPRGEYPAWTEKQR